MHHHLYCVIHISSLFMGKHSQTSQLYIILAADSLITLVLLYLIVLNTRIIVSHKSLTDYYIG
jgi:hypothetical protein